MLPVRLSNRLLVARKSLESKKKKKKKNNHLRKEAGTNDASPPPTQCNGVLHAPIEVMMIRNCAKKQGGAVVCTKQGGVKRNLGGV
jgi:hypothetical protein